MSKITNKLSPANSYLTFLKLVNGMNPTQVAPFIDADEEALLNAISLHWNTGKPLAVRESMQLNTLGSPSTLHRRMSKLKALDLIEFRSTPSNQRIKLLVPSKRTLHYFDKLGAAIAKALKG